MYLFDSDILIQAKNTYYGFAICPGFWSFLEREAEHGEIRSIRQVRMELEAGNDDLAEWARRVPAFFLDPTPETNEAMRRVSAWVQAGDFTDTAKRDFLGRADAFLVAHALGAGYTVVTHEVRNNPGERKKVKIPTVCDALGVPSERPYNVLRIRGAVFVL